MRLKARQEGICPKTSSALLLTCTTSHYIQCQFHSCGIPVYMVLILNRGSKEWDYGWKFFKIQQFLREFQIGWVLQLIKMITIYTVVPSLPRIQNQFTNIVCQFCSSLVVKTPTEINCKITSIESPPTAELSENFIRWTAIELEPWNCFLNYT